VLRRDRNLDDRRSIVVSLTPKGRRLVEPLREAAKRHEAAVLEPFGKGNAITLKRVLQRLIDQHAARPEQRTPLAAGPRAVPLPAQPADRRRRRSRVSIDAGTR
jgi:hypothetical protein